MRAKEAASRAGRVLGEICTRQNVSLAVIALCCVAIGPLGRFTNALSIVLLLAMLVNIREDDFYFYSVVFLFFWQQFFIYGDNPAYRVYSYLVLVKFLAEIAQARFRVQYFPALAVFAAFCLFAVGRMTLRMGLNMLADVLLTYLILLRVREKPPLMRRMALLYAAAALFSGLYSLTGGAVVQYEVGIGAQEEVVRAFGTLADANYAGFFFDMAIFMVLCVRGLRPIPRGALLAALYALLIATNSLTGILCNLLGVGFFLLLRYRGKGALYALLLAAGAAAFAWALLNVPALQGIEALSSLAVRLREQLAALRQGRLSDFFTGRTELWAFSWDYFLHLPLWQKLIGGTVVTSVVTVEIFLKNVGAVHQTYLQGLLDFGILGALIVFGTKVGQWLADLCACLRGRAMPLPEDLMQMTLLSSLGFFVYALTIDFFMDWRFLFFYFF